MATDDVEERKIRHVWRGMVSRCREGAEGLFPRYAGRGIRVAAEWQGKEGFARFCAHVGPRPSPAHTIDRIDNDGHYEPGNVQWATRSEQVRNTSIFHGKNYLVRALDPSLAPVRAPPRDMNPAIIYLARLSKGSAAAMGASLVTIVNIVNIAATVETFPWYALRYTHAIGIRSRLMDDEKLSPATVNKIICALRGVAREAWRLGLMSMEDYARLADVPGVKGSRLPAGRHVPIDEIQRVADSCRDGAIGVRDRALIALTYGCGLRRAEAVGIDMSSYSRAGVRVIGKGNKERMVPVTGWIADAVSAWVGIRGSEPGPLFVRVRKGDRVELKNPLTTSAVHMILAKRCKETGIAHVSPHDMRRTFIGEALTNGVDISTVQRIVGHANVATTARYDRRGFEAMREAMEKMEPIFSAVFGAGLGKEKSK